MSIVHLSCGDVRGTEAGGVHAFKGIPYAEPISGEARWLPPKPRARWSGTLDASRFGQASIQFKKRVLVLSSNRRAYLSGIGGELPLEEGDDCLTLNIWTPAIDRNARLPVMVYIHGGGYTTGAANQLYDGAHFARAGVVMVAIQYRLGPPGFLHGSGLFNGDFCADNRAMLDHILALQWVQEHIGAFGGDAGRVTLFGESAGAFSTYQLCASPLARGLFHRAIPMGGMPWICGLADEYHHVTQDVLRDFGIAPGDAAALSALDRDALLRMQSTILKRVYGNKDPARYGQLGRTHIGAMGAAINADFPSDPVTAWRNGRGNDIDLMLGTCADDGQLFSMVFPLPMALSARLFMTLFRSLAPREDLSALLDYYRRKLPGKSIRQRFDQANNDLFYRKPTIAAAEAHARQSPGRTWLYQVDYHCRIPALRAIHGIDVALAFGKDSAGWTVLPQDETSAAVSAAVVGAFTRFAASGSPVTAATHGWKPYDTATRATMVFDRSTRMEPDWGGELRRYWDGSPDLRFVA